MANRLKVAMIQTLMTLWRQRWSQRQNAKRLGVDRETVGRDMRQIRLSQRSNRISSFLFNRRPVGKRPSAEMVDE